jgi:hypothetical protein
MTNTAPTTTVTADDTDARRAGVIAGLRALADFLETHPDLPVPSMPELTVFPRGESDAEERAAVDAIAVTLGVPATGTTHYRAARRFGEVTYEAITVAREEMARHNALMSYRYVVTPETDR